MTSSRTSHAFVRSRRASWPALATLAAVALSAPAASAASLQQISSFGDNPSGIKMFLYVPDKVAPKPAVLVGVHWCHGDAQGFYTGTKFSQLADKYGFIIIYPSAVSSDGCWDVHSSAVLTHNGGGDAQGIISMVKYVIQNKNGDASRVFVSGHSSGGMMTNVLVGSYPDVFKAGAAFAGVPHSCFAGPDTWNTNCAQGKITKTGSQWADGVRNAYPGYTGPRPRMQLWHGTLDDTINFHNFGEEIKEWTSMLGVDEKPTSTEKNTPQSTWTRTRYADANGNVMVEAVQEEGQPHNLQIVAEDAVRFFGLDGSPIPPNPGGTVDGGVREAAASTDAAASDAGRSYADGAEAGMGGAGGSAGSDGSGGSNPTSGSGGSTTGSSGSGTGPSGMGGEAGIGGGGASSGSTKTGGDPGATAGAGRANPEAAGSGAGSALGEDAGCSCHTAAGGHHLGATAAGLLGVAIFVRRRRANSWQA